MNTYLVTIPRALTDDQQQTVEAHGWSVSAELHSDVMAAAPPTTVISVEDESPEQAVAAVAEAFGLEPGELRVEEQ